MKLRPYIDTNDYKYVNKWVSDRRTHALWCADLIPYPLSEKELSAYIEKDVKEWGSCAYTITDDVETPIGFFVYSVNAANNSGFLKFVVLDNSLRGKGYGTEMLKLIVKYAFEGATVTEVHLNVFDVNVSARKCYDKVGFVQQGVVDNAFAYEEERWGRCHMVVKR